MRSGCLAIKGAYVADKASDFRRLAQGEAGYSKTKRTYVNERTGEVIPLSQYQKLQRGGQNYREYRESRMRTGIQPRSYKARTNTDALFSEYYSKQVRDSQINGTPIPSPEQARQDPEWKLLPTFLKSKDRRPHGRKATALIWLGRRDDPWSWNVGETPD